MSVYVDRLMWCKPNKNWRWKKVSHLTADTIQELHLFAIEVGLRREWFQPTSKPHYDLTIGARRYAVKLGAIERRRM